MKLVPIDELQAQRYEGKFFVTLDGQHRAAYFLSGHPQVIKIDGEHTYLWYRDGRLNSIARVRE